MLRIVLEGFYPSGAREVSAEKKHTGREACENADAPHEPVKELAIVGCAHGGLEVRSAQERAQAREERVVPFYRHKPD